MDNFDVSNLNRTKNFNKYFLDHSKKKITLRQIEFIEVIELDDLGTAEKQIFKIIRENKFFTMFGSANNLSASEITEIKKKLDGFKSSYKTWSEGKLFSVLNENNNTDSDLFKSIAFSYFKTYDNLLVLKLNVTPSKKFFQELKSIEKNKTIPNDYITISHFKDFIRTKRVIRGFRASGNLKEKGLQNLIFDLNFQLKKNFLSGLKGVFSKRNDTNPFIAYFNTKSKLDYKELNKGFGIIDSYGISDIFYDQNNGYYAINYWNETKKNKGLYVIGENDAFPKKYDSDKNLEQYCFSVSVFKSWATVHYLRSLNKELTNLRKSIYQFINSKNTIKFRKQVKIKTKLSKKKIRFQRIQREFNKRNIHFYFMSHDYKSNLLCAVNNRWENYENYYSFIKKQIEYYIKDGDEQISDLDKYFEEISSINLIKLNYKFQFIATLLTIIGLVFAITNAEQIFNLIKKLWE
tara:strand:- start:2081 stop:3469 length:1389 start_codon:yes stop_codon:yes gene_type:complete